MKGKITMPIGNQYVEIDNTTRQHGHGLPKLKPHLASFFLPSFLAVSTHNLSHG